MEKSKTKGFTLVEIIVVLVIIAILAATTVPALVGYINDAKDKVAITEARTYRVAMQSIASDLRGMGYSDGSIGKYLMGINSGVGSLPPSSYTKTVASLTGEDYYKDLTVLDQLTFNSQGTITYFKLKTTNKRTVMYADGTMTVTATK